MTRKRFWKLRNALNVRLNEWAKENLGGCSSGITDKALRPVSGKPLVDFKVARERGFGSSYKELWENVMRSGLNVRRD